MSPLDAMTGADDAGATASEPIISVTPEALEHLLELRDDEPDADQLGLRLAIASRPGEDFRYDLSFDAKKVLFNYKPPKPQGFRIYEIGVDGTGLRRLTTNPAIDSTYSLRARNCLPRTPYVRP